MLVAENVVWFTADWTDSFGRPWLSFEESRALIRDYEHSRGQPFDAEERETVDAAHLYILRTTRDGSIRHRPWASSRSGPADGWRALLERRLNAGPGSRGDRHERGLAAALALGAAGAVVGARLCATEESLMHPAAKQQLVVGTGNRTVRPRV